MGSAMKRLGPQLFFFLLVGAAALTLACGSSSSHIPQTVTVTPATADAQDFPDGQVQFAATAYYNTMPTPVNKAAATWSACVTSTSQPMNGVTISTSGLAECSGGTGTYMIDAFVPDPSFHGVCAGGSTPCGGACGGVVGSAQLTCP
jgi:hypothetical protein